MTDRIRRTLLVLAAALSLVAAGIHLWVIPEHFDEWWGYGTFFLVVAVLQVLFALTLVRWPRRGLLVAGIVGNLAIIVLWVWTRTVGIPVFGPGAGETEPVGDLDLASKVAEGGLVLLIAVVLWRWEAVWSDAVRNGPQHRSTNDAQTGA